MSQLFTTFLLQPIVNLLVWLYQVVPGQDVGIAIILLTVIVKLVLYPLTHAQIKQQRALQEIQPKIEEIRKRLKDNKEEQARELVALYAKEKVNPAASCLPLLIQLPVFIALYQALTIGLTSKGLSMLYAFVPNPGMIDTRFLSVMDLSKPSYVLAVAAAAIQFLQTKQILKPPAATVQPPPAEVKDAPAAKDESMSAMMNKQMTYMMPVMTIVIGVTLPGGLTLYWLVMSALTILQQWFVMKKQPLKVVARLR